MEETIFIFRGVGILYLVATPIGNLEDITLRAIKTLAAVDQILAEDTRRVSKLLHHYKIQTPKMPFHEHNELKKLPSILRKLENGKNIALVSNAGTPLISDPGFKLVREVQRQGFKIVPIPGPSAVLSALIISGLPTDKFTSLGYLPRTKTKRRNLLNQLQSSAEVLKTTFVAFESPHRFKEALKDLAETIPDANIAIARELTKIHEEVWRGTPKKLLHLLSDKKIKGEITLVIQVPT